MFCLLSLFFLSVIESLEGGVSALDFKQFISRLRGDFILVGGSLLTFLAIYKGARFSPYLFLTFCSYITFRSFYVFFIDLDKVILFLIFLYTIVSYNFFLFLKMELREPFYNPSFPTNILPTFKYKKLPITLKKEAVSFEAFLTNWGESGFFAQTGDSNKIRGTLDVEITIEGQTFFASGEVMTSNEGGIGVKIVKNPVPDLGWSDYYGIINELGFRPSYS